MHDQDTGTLLRRLRLERGWTQRQAAELLNSARAQAVSKWERGQGCPDVGDAAAPAEFLASAWREFWTETCFRRRRMEEI